MEGVLTISMPSVWLVDSKRHECFDRDFACQVITLGEQRSAPDAIHSRAVNMDIA